MIKRLSKILFLAGAAAVFLVILFGVYFYTPVEAVRTRITIKKGNSIRKIGQTLAENGVIRHPALFTLFVRLSGYGGTLKAGTYRFENKNSPRDVFVQLKEGLVIPWKVTIVEGWTLNQIGEALGTSEDLPDPEWHGEWEKKIADKGLLRSLGVEADTLEGYLYPETYHFDPGTSPETMIRAFVAHFNKNYEKHVAPLASLQNRSRRAIVTLASIIEKETSVAAERPLVASAFYNRLARDMHLQSDPTIIYGLKNFDGNIRKKDILNPHPYNTYVHAGLPPGPICNPGLESLKAAAEPAKTDYLYFVSRNDGTHVFSETAVEHGAAVRRYQLNGEIPSP